MARPTKQLKALEEDEYFAKIIKDENQDEHFEHQDNYHHFDCQKSNKHVLDT